MISAAAMEMWGVQTKLHFSFNDTGMKLLISYVYFQNCLSSLNSTDGERNLVEPAIYVLSFTSLCMVLLKW